MFIMIIEPNFQAPHLVEINVPKHHNVLQSIVVLLTIPLRRKDSVSAIRLAMFENMTHVINSSDATEGSELQSRKLCVKLN